MLKMSEEVRHHMNEPGCYSNKSLENIQEPLQTTCSLKRLRVWGLALHYWETIATTFVKPGLNLWVLILKRLGKQFI